MNEYKCTISHCMCYFYNPQVVTFSLFWFFPRLHWRRKWLGLNHDIPSLNSQLTYHSPLGRTSCIPTSLSHNVQLPLLITKADFSKEPISIHCRAPVVSTLWAHLCVDHSALFAFHFFPLLYHLIRVIITLIISIQCSSHQVSQPAGEEILLPHLVKYILSLPVSSWSWESVH